ncbi:hypothetical protein GCM10022212_30430 [Actimicrobium antarcticum]|uniref:Uncharacterized protein n=1 Tax=Actimicrobium antarcticum TaxID=1051899 RepID=A0ABP7TR32_9BURK
MRDNQVGVADDLAFAVGQFAGTLDVEVGHHSDLDAATSATGNFFGIALENIECAGAYGADA